MLSADLATEAGMDLVDAVAAQRQLDFVVDNAAADRHRCLWATAPDVICDPVGTLVESRPWLPRMRSLGVPAAFVGRDGCENGLVPWAEFDVLFLGGSTEWKIGPAAGALAQEAVARGKRVHMGRVNSLKRLRIAQSFGCSSADGTYLCFGPQKNYPTIMSWVGQMRLSPVAA